MLIDPGRTDAVIFDVDGVITDTASLHFDAWKAVFDEELGRRAAGTDQPAEPFTREDYLAYVDGKPRYDGVRSFLASRGIELPEGDPDDPPGRDTVCGIGNRKDEQFREHLTAGAVVAYPSTVALLDRLATVGIRAAAISASRNAREVLRAAGVLDRLDVLVDGRLADELDLPGKPDPAVFLEAARRVDVAPDRAVVVEDARSGVEAGRRGGFGTVIGVDRAGQREALLEHGADVVVADLAEVTVGDAERVLPDDGPGTADASDWSLVYDDYQPEQEGLREALCTLGNGYMATRGAAPECHAGTVHYPGTYLAGVYNRLTTRIAGQDIENEDLVNVPNWLVLAVRPGGGDWLDPDGAEVLAYRQELDIRRAVLTRHMELRDAQGRETAVVQRRFVHMQHPHVAGLQTMLVARNWSGPVTVRSGLDGAVRNAGVERYRALADRHLQVTSTGESDPQTVALVAETVQSRIRIGVAARTRLRRNGADRDPRRALIDEDGSVAHELTFELDEGEPATVDKIVTVFTSRDHAISEPGLAARCRVAELGDFDELLASHTLAWQHLWDRFAISLDGADGMKRAQMILRLHILHVLQTVSPNSMEVDAGVPARGLHGEAYRGHVFWDELFVFPILNLRLPVLTRTLLHYRHRRLGTARQRARREGLDGALFPWQSGSDGREESQSLHLNPRSGEWVPDHSHLQRHVNHAIAYNVWQYWQVTQDLEFIRFHAGELLIELARLMASLATHEEADDRYHIRRVMGPDEYHEAYPDADRPGIDDNAYTNVMSVWVLLRAMKLLDTLSSSHRRELEQVAGLSGDEIDRWEHITRRMYVPFHGDRIISQFEGYDELEELDWEAYRRRYGDIQRMDRILKAEGDSPDRYKVSKQADVLMLFYLLPLDQVRRVLDRLGYTLEDDDLQRTVRYYLERTSHGSTLSRLVHSLVLSRLDRPQSWQLFTEALESDVADIQGGTTEEGIHLGAMAGTVDLLQRAYAGIATRGNVLWFDPALPDQLDRLGFTLHYRGHRLAVAIDRERLRITASPTGMPPVRVGVAGEVHEVRAGESTQADLVAAPTRHVPVSDVPGA